MSTPTDDRTNQERSLTLFAFLWACFTIFHLGKTGTWDRSSLDILMAISAVSVLFAPSNVTYFLVLMVVQAVNFLAKSPMVINHAVFAVIVNLTVLAAVLPQVFRRFGQPIDKAELYETFAPVVRASVVIMYFYVVFHKLNHDYFLLDYSAAVAHYDNLADTLVKLGMPIVPRTVWAYQASIYGTLIIEGAIPLLLFFRSTRIAGLWVGLLFHFMLSVEDFYDFSSIAYALLFLFVPCNFPAQLEQWWRSSRLGDLGRGLGSLAIFRTLRGPFWIALAWAIGLAVFDVLDRQTSFRVLKVLWMFYGLAVVVAAFGALHGRPSEPSAHRRRLFRFRSTAFWIFPILVFINGAAPYLGLKTRGSFAMFSNLRTEGGQTNHLIVPVWAQIADYQKDLVQILDSSDPFLMRSRNGRMPYFNLRNHTSELAARGEKDIYVKFLRNGQEVTVHNAEQDPELSSPYSYLERKLLVFGGINPGEHQINRH